jgi:hypothetical protein
VSAGGSTMSKRWGKAQPEREPPDRELTDRDLTATMVPIACAGKGCEERTSLVLPGDSPYEGGMFPTEGWTVLAAKNAPFLSFLCPDCFQKEVEFDNVSSAARLSTNKRVSG